MNKPEIKMENYPKIINLVQQQRKKEITRGIADEHITDLQKELRILGVNCHTTTNCVHVGKLCFKCRNNNARRSYFRDLLEKGTDVESYAMSASCFMDASEE